ncbi:uncharacterized protein LOC120849009 [Ixodes scapularis]|uniref:uncharacterized protein LOC120849009 n=1 Tax=Ixodes scapularis TaxID=6945 RepID=UPI001A9EF7C9|nr:uncharacterized protein LOC120849009 [Ixodes scapularis]
MTLRKWTANDEQLQEQFNKEEPKIMTEEKSLSPSPISKVLGMMWEHEGDCFIYKVEALLEFLSANADTKWFILKAASGVFDPLGLIATFVLTAKLLFQKLWTLGISWDEELPADLITELHAWTADLVQLHSLSIPRHAKRGIQAGAKKVQLHVFVDASTKAYGSLFLEDTPQLEVKKETHMLLEKDQEVPSLFDTRSYENYQKVLLITAWVIGFANNAQTRNDKIRGGSIAAELDKAEQYWIRQIQNERFQTDIILREKNTTEVNVRLAEYHPFFDENKILRVGGRLQRLTESLDVKHPVLLPNDHNFVKLIVMHAHCKVMHGEQQAQCVTYERGTG